MSSTNNSKLCESRTKDFHKWYKHYDTQKRYEGLTAATKEKLEKLLETESIKGVVQGRTKGPDSLEEKLVQMETDIEFETWVSGDSLRENLTELARFPSFTKCMIWEEFDNRVVGMVATLGWEDIPQLEISGKYLRSQLADLVAHRPDDEFEGMFSLESLGEKLKELAEDSHCQRHIPILRALDDLIKDPKFENWWFDDRLKEKLATVMHDDNLVEFVEGEWRWSYLQDMLERNSILFMEYPQSIFGNWISDRDHILKHPDMGDLAAVRIGLYLPGDVGKLAEKVEQYFDIKHTFGTVTGGRDVTKGRNLDIASHEEGRWLDAKNDSWEHYGYKSWQVVAQWKQGPFVDLQVEIQFGTVVTQAWAEVQHKIIYKTPDNIVAAPSVKRMIDAFNGLAITIDIILKDLELGIREAEEKAEELDQRPFEDERDFLKWFRSQYARQMRPKALKRWHCSLDSAHLMLCHVKRQPFMRSKHSPEVVVPEGVEIEVESRCKLPSTLGAVRGPKPCPAEFTKLIKENGLIRPRTEGDQNLDISDLLLQAMGYDGSWDSDPSGERTRRRLVKVDRSAQTPFKPFIWDHGDWLKFPPQRGEYFDLEGSDTSSSPLVPSPVPRPQVPPPSLEQVQAIQLQRPLPHPN